MADPTTDDVTAPPVSKYRLTVTIRGNSHDEIESALRALTRGGYLLDSNYHERDEFNATDGRTAARLEHTNSDMSPERYERELDEWWQARKAARRIERGASQ